MRVPRYWEKETASATAPNGQKITTGCWAWSDQSREDARRRAVEAAKRVAGRLLGKHDLPHHYGYDERLPREEIVDEFTDELGTQAIVTRNAYGSLILNTRDLMFIDVDFPPPSTEIPLPRFLRKWLGKPDPVSPQDSVGDQIRSTAETYRDTCFRIYRTRNGYRVMVIDRPIKPDSDQALQMLDRFHADPLYQRMCRNQACFRARLTPKAWRCQISPPPARFPFADREQQSAYRNWERAYVDATARYSTCDFVETIGIGQPAATLSNLIDLHDKITKATVSDPLA